MNALQKTILDLSKFRCFLNVSLKQYKGLMEESMYGTNDLLEQYIKMKENEVTLLELMCDSLEEIKKELEEK